MKTPKKTHAELVNAYFQRGVDHWQNLYSDKDVWGTTIRDRQQTLLNWIDQLDLPAGARILEVGCGAGLLSLALAERGFHVWATDSVEAMLDQVRRNAAGREVAGQLTLEVRDVYTLQFDPTSFDLVLAIGVVSWLEYVEKAIHEMARVLKPGGYLLLTSENWVGLGNHVDLLINPLFAPLKARVKHMLADAGIRQPTPELRSLRRKMIDRTLARMHLVKIKAQTHGFGLSLGRHAIPDPLGSAIHCRLQNLANRGVPVLRSLGRTYFVLSRKENLARE